MFGRNRTQSGRTVKKTHFYGDTSSSVDSSKQSDNSQSGRTENDKEATVESDSDVSTDHRVFRSRYYGQGFNLQWQTCSLFGGEYRTLQSSRRKQYLSFGNPFQWQSKLQLTMVMLMNTQLPIDWIILVSLGSFFFIRSLFFCCF